MCSGGVPRSLALDRFFAKAARAHTPAAGGGITAQASGAEAASAKL